MAIDYPLKEGGGGGVGGAKSAAGGVADEADLTGRALLA